MFEVIGRDLCQGSHLKLRLDVLPVSLHGLNGNEQSVSYLLSLKPLRDQLYYLKLSTCKLRVKLRLADYPFHPAFATKWALDFFKVKESVSIDIGCMCIIFAKIAATETRYDVELKNLSVQFARSVLLA